MINNLIPNVFVYIINYLFLYISFVNWILFYIYIVFRKNIMFDFIINVLCLYINIIYIHIILYVCIYTIFFYFVLHYQLNGFYVGYLVIHLYVSQYPIFCPVIFISLSIHLFLGLPLLLISSTLISITTLSVFYSSLLLTCPKKLFIIYKLIWNNNKN